MRDAKIGLLISILSTGWLLFISSARAQADDYINLSASGVMSAGLEISIDLQTGDAVKRSSPFFSYRKGKKPDWTETKRRLTPDELSALKKVVKDSLAEGLRSKACDDEDLQAREQGRSLCRPFTADSIISLSVRLDGQFGHAPERACTSPAFNALWTAAYNAASVGATPPAP